jgi:hypothetical protein
MEKRDVFKVQRRSVNDCLPVVHPRNFGAGEFVCPL